MRFLGEYRGPGRPGRTRGASGWSSGATGGPSWARSSARRPTARPLFLENPVRGEILRVASADDLDAEAPPRRAAGARASPPAASSSPGDGSRWTWSTSRSILGGERMVFYYLSEKRVDFRELVKDLARAFQTRIEMRQIGVRDEAKLLADYGDCGKPVCCNTHLSRMPPGLDADGQGPENDARPLENLGTLW